MTKNNYAEHRMTISHLRESTVAKCSCGWRASGPEAWVVGVAAKHDLINPNGDTSGGAEEVDRPDPDKAASAQAASD